MSDYEYGSRDHVDPCPATIPGATTGARATPIFQTTSYVFDDVDHAGSLFNLQVFGNIYSRITNPKTAGPYEERVAALEGGRAAFGAASSWHAAQLLVFHDPAGDRRGVHHREQALRLLEHRVGAIQFRNMGWTEHFGDPDDPENFRAALTAKCKAIFIENLANPGGVVLDMEAIANDRARARGIRLHCP